MGIKKGDIVTVNDGSYATRVDCHEMHPCLGLCNDTFTVITTAGGHLRNRNGDHEVHNIFIKNNVNGRIYLHTKDFCTIVEPEEMTLADVCKLIGKEVKIIQ